jgi:aryl-alcohol dehydrogenase-like predicted oxidoreductase
MRIKQSGIAIGLSTSSPAQSQTIERALAVEIEGARLFDCVQATWNPLEPSAGEALRAAHAEGLGVIIKEALANGRLTARNAETGFAARKARLRSLADDQGVGIDALVIATVLAQPWVHCVLSGAASVEQLNANLLATRVSSTLTDAEIAEDFAEAPEDYWRRRSALEWN